MLSHYCLKYGPLSHHVSPTHFSSELGLRSVPGLGDLPEEICAGDAAACMLASASATGDMWPSSAVYPLDSAMNKLNQHLKLSS